MILLQKQILTIILDFFGPDVIAVHILTSAVQIFRDHEDTIRELWWCGRAATEWLRDRRTERIKREIERRKRARSRATLARELWRRRHRRDMPNLQSPPSSTETSSADEGWDLRRDPTGRGRKVCRPWGPARVCRPCPMCGQRCTGHPQDPYDNACTHALEGMNLHEWGS